MHLSHLEAVFSLKIPRVGQGLGLPLSPQAPIKYHALKFDLSKYHGRLRPRATRSLFLYRLQCSHYTTGLPPEQQR